MKFNKNDFSHKTEIQIRFNDIDIVGHVNNVVFQHYYDMAKLEYFNRILGNLVDWKKTTMVMANVIIDYIEPIYLEEKIYVLTRVVEIGDKSLTIIQQICNNSEMLKSRAISVMVGFDFRDKNSVSIPADWKEKIVGYEKEVGFKYPQRNKVG
jgi:acyl-CoA thioester hydrolase